MTLSVGIVTYFKAVRFVVERSTGSADTAVAAVTDWLSKIGKTPTHIHLNAGTFCPHGFQTRKWICFKTGEGGSIPWYI